MTSVKMNVEPQSASLADRTDQQLPSNEPWPPVILTKEQIDSEIERLAALPEPANGRRESLILHPRALPNAPGLAPGIQVKLCVLKPGETTRPFRHNATEVTFCIRGDGFTDCGDRRIRFGQFDVWNTPSYAVQQRTNDGNELQVCLNYSNAALLQYMQIYISEDDPQIECAEVIAHEDDVRRMNPYGVFPIGEDGAKLMPYELLIDPPTVESSALYWPWEKVHAELKKLEDLGREYIGRRLYLLYNPITGRTNGTTPSFFATITIRPPKIVDKPHRHVSAAINYYFQGRGRSTVAGNVYEWKAGDLMLSAPGWAVHNHAAYDEAVYELTIQDQPLNIAMESLLWQESINEPPALLGAKAGFQTNRAAVTG